MTLATQEDHASSLPRLGAGFSPLVGEVAVFETASSRPSSKSRLFLPVCGARSLQIPQTTTFHMLRRPADLSTNVRQSGRVQLARCRGTKKQPWASNAEAQSVLRAII